MRQVWIPKAGPPEVLEVREAPDTLPGPREVRIRVEASGVNFADVAGRLGIYPDLPPMPVVPGYEVSGQVDAVGSEVETDWIGRDVIAMCRFGGYSDVVCVPEAQAFTRPAGLDADRGAALPVNYVTAYQLMVVMGSLKPGETVLVHSAGGGVGIAAIQIAARLGARVIGTASARKHDFLKSIGVESCIDYTTEDFEARVRDLTSGRGVELALDAVGGSSFAKSYRCLAPTGRLGMFGMSAASPGKTRSRLAVPTRASSASTWAICGTRRPASANGPRRCSSGRPKARCLPWWTSASPSIAPPRPTTTSRTARTSERSCWSPERTHWRGALEAWPTSRCA
jgi:NADPH:quinone reductase-like Zn-dependent oxidoreductase